MTNRPQARPSRPAAPQPPKSRRNRGRAAAGLPWHLSPYQITVFMPLLLVAATFLAYQPVWHAGFVWDDDLYVTGNAALRDVVGLWRIWFEVGAVPQYYPLAYTVFWVEHHLWGIDPLGYHLVNVALHALAAVLLGRLLTRLHVRGAWLAAFLFALHPVCVESVAWITELKNALSAVFYFGSALAYAHFTELHDAGDTKSGAWGWYAAALILFAAALLSKTVACSLPAALLLVRWWQKGRLRAADIVPVLPFFCVGLGLGLETAWIEKHVIRAQGTHWSLTLAERCVLAGRVLWFYAGKLLLPVNLTFIYPRWHISAGVWWQWLFPITALAVPVVLWLTRRRIGRGPLTAVLLFAGTLAPALGFFDVYFMRYSYVADHFQYLASVGLITLAAAGIRTLFAWLAPRRDWLEALCCGVLLAFLGVLTWRQAGMYTNLETLWRATLARNPDCPMALDSLGYVLQQRGQVDEAIAHYKKAIALQPEDEYGHNLLGSALLDKGQIDDALPYLQRAVELQPDHAQLLFNFGAALMQKGRLDEAIRQFQRAVEEKPDYTEARNSLGLAFFQKQQWGEALTQFEMAVKSQPLDAQARTNLATALYQSGRLGEAIVQFQKALEIRPDHATAYYNLRQVAWVLATSPDPEVRNGAKAVTLAQQVTRLSRGSDPLIAGTLAAAYAEAGQFSEARATVERAVQLASAQGKTALVADLQAQARFYEAGQPYREAPRDATQYKVELR